MFWLRDDPQIGLCILRSNWNGKFPSHHSEQQYNKIISYVHLAYVGWKRKKEGFVACVFSVESFESRSVFSQCEESGLFDLLFAWRGKTVVLFQLGDNDNNVLFMFLSGKWGSGCKGFENVSRKVSVGNCFTWMASQRTNIVFRRWVNSR